MSKQKRKFNQIQSKEDGILPPPKKKIQHDNKPVKKEAVVVTGINVAHFAEHRAIEIQAMAELVKDTGGNHMAFQKLPRHMRRRAMSHNIKRIPRRLHTAAKAEISKTKAPGKRPSRRHRRRPSNLLSEYERRKRRIGWLETHIWHAKRFKMVEKWGYRLASHPNDKSIRACYRAVKRHCLLQDVSFEATIELKGSRSNLLDGLKHLTSSDTGLTFAAKLTETGTRWGQLVLYSYDSYPTGAIGPVTYLWRAQAQPKANNVADNLETLWISCHPSIYNFVLAELNSCFASHTDTNTVVPNETKSDTKVVITSLKYQLIKFRLYGPASNLVLAETLKPANIDSVSGGSDLEEKAAEPRWWQDFYSASENKQVFVQQSDIWSRVANCQSPNEAPPNCVIALTVRDPRLMLPPKRNKVSLTSTSSVTKSLPLDLFSENVAASSLWELWVRENVKDTKISEQKLNTMKSKHLVPGTPLELGDLESRIPVLLMQRSGASSTSSACRTNLSHGSGWDLILPSGFAMAFWVALVYRGARAGGTREARSTNLQSGLLSVPIDYPDTQAGQEELRSECEARRAKHDRMPPAKRPNFVKLGYPHPFKYELTKLVTECCDKWVSANSLEIKSKYKESKSPTVLRNRKMLRLLGAAVANPKSFLASFSKKKVKETNVVQNNVIDCLLSTDTGKLLIGEELHSLVPVRLTILQRGVPAVFGRICQPIDEDLKALDSDKTYGGPSEPKHKDPGMAIRKEERKERLRLRKKRKRGKGKKMDLKKSEVSAAAEFNEKELGLQTEGVPLSVPEDDADTEKGLSKPDESEKILGSTSRNIIGYVWKGDFDLSTGQGLGFGFVSVVSLLELVKQQENRKSTLVFIRNSSSFQYRFATASLIM